MPKEEIKVEVAGWWDNGYRFWQVTYNGEAKLFGSLYDVLIFITEIDNEQRKK